MVTNPATDTAPRSGAGKRGTHIALWGVQAITAIGFVSVAFAKFSGAPQAVTVFEAMGVGTWMIYTIATLEVVGAVALLIPRLSGVAGSAFVALTVGAIITHLIFVGSPIPALVMLVLAAVVAIGRRRTTAELVESVRSGQ